MIRKGSRLESRTGKTGTATSDVTYRTNAGRSRQEIRVQWDHDGEWKILLRNVKEITE